MPTHFERTRVFQWILRLPCLLVLALLVLPSAGQTPATQANVVTTFSPPYTVPLSELYVSQQLNVTVTAVNGPLPSGKLSVVIQGNNGIRLENDFASSPFSLDIEQGVPYQLTGGDIDEIFQASNFRATGITVGQAFNDGLPAGNYEVCFRVYVSGRTGWTPISQASPIGCASFTITESSTAVLISAFVQPPPFTPDLESYLYKLNATLTSATSRRVRLFLTISGDNGVVIRTHQGIITPDLISLQAAVPYTLSSIDLEPYFQISNLDFVGVSAQAVQSAGLPEGNYRFCLRAVDGAGNFISADDPMGCSNLVTIRLLEPPQLITPKCGIAIKAGQGEMPVFSWTPPPGAGPGLVYTLRIVEMVDPDKNPNDAMLSATTPAFVEETIVGATTFLYGPGQAVLEPGKKYAWQVIAGLGTGPDMGDLSRGFRNKGKSEVCWFTIEEQLTGLVFLTELPKSPGPKVGSIVNDQTVPVAGVSGKLYYKFKPEVKASKSTDASNKGGNVVMLSKTGTPYNNSPGIDASGALPLGNVKVSLIRVYLLDGKVDNKPYHLDPIKKEDVPFGGDAFDQNFKDNEEVIATTTTAPDGSFNFDFAHTEKDLGLVQQGASVTMGGGEFFNHVNGNIHKVYRLRVESNYYCSPEVNIKVDPWQAVDLGTLVSYVKSYNLKVKVISTNASFYEKQAAGPGNALDKVATTVFRKSKVSQVPYNEGEKVSGGNKLKVPSSIDMVASGESDKDGVVLIRNLVQHDPDNNLDRYYVKCETSKTDGVFNYKTKEVRYNPFSIAEKKNFPFNKFSSVIVNPPKGLSHTEYFGSDVVWNSELEVKTYTKEIELYPELPRIYGQVYNKFTTSTTIEGAKVSLFSVYPPGQPKVITKQIAFTDKNGRFEFNDLDVPMEIKYDPKTKGFLNEDKAPVRTVSTKVPGYKPEKFNAGKMLYGAQTLANLALEPDGWLAGDVVDEEGNPVMARVYVDSVMKKTEVTLTYNSPDEVQKPAANTFKAVAATSYVSRFIMVVPSGKGKKIIIDPDDEAYFTETYTEDILPKSANNKVRQYVVYRAQKRMKFRILAGKSYTGKLQIPSTPKPLANVSVTLDLPTKKITQVSDADGYVSFAFESADTQFSFIVEPPDDMDYESTIYTVSDVTDSKTFKEYWPCYLKPATSISGIVTLKGSATPVAEALVYIDMGNGNMLKDITDEQGRYKLAKVSKSPTQVTVHASKPGAIPNLISQSKTIILDDKNELNFELEQDKEMAIQDIFGFKVLVQEMKKEPDGTRTIVKGSLIEIPANENFKLYDAKLTLPFSNVKVKPSSQKTSAGIPLGVPVSDFLTLDLQELKLMAHDAFGAMVRMDQGMLLKVENENASGFLKGKVSVIPASFNFSQSILSLPKGKFMHLLPPGGEGTDVKVLTVGEYGKQKFSIGNEEGSDLAFKYLGFGGKATRAQSYLDGDHIVLATMLTTEKIPGMTPSQIELNAGPMVVKANGVEPASMDQPVSFALEQWTVTGPKWSIQSNSSGILIPGATIKTGVVDIPMNNLVILPNNLDASGFDIKSLTLSGVAPINVVDSKNAIFGYNPSVGKDQKGHWELRLLGKDGVPAATVSGLPGMEAGATIDFDIFSLISNGEQRLEFSKYYKGTTFHKVLKTNPIAFSGGDQYFKMVTAVDLGIPGVSESNAILQFEKEGGAIVMKILPFAVDVEGPGFVKFYTSMKQGSQQLKPGEFTSMGQIRDKEGIALEGKLHRTVNDAWIEVDPKGQNLPLGGAGTSLANVEGKMEADMSAAAWKNFWFSGELQGFKGMTGDTRKTFTVHGSITADDESLNVKNIPTPFGGMNLTYDLKKSRLTGDMQLKQSIGPMSLNGMANITIDPSGWHFISGGQLSMPGLGGMAAGMLIGDYDHMPPEVADKLMQFAYNKEVPPSFANGISGFFFTGERDLPFSIPNYSIDVGVLSAKMGAQAGLDARMWMNFDDTGNEYGIGAMAFAHVYFKATSITCTKLGADAKAELGAKGIYNSGSGTFTVSGCGSISVSGTAKQCFPTPCWDGICCKACIGGSISKAVSLEILLDSNGNTDLSFGFDNCSGQPPMAANW